MKGLSKAEVAFIDVHGRALLEWTGEGGKMWFTFKALLRSEDGRAASVVLLHSRDRKPLIHDR
jgi:hypothetical protein